MTVERDAAQRAYAAGLGASEWEAFVRPAIDVTVLAVALDNVDLQYERGWSPAHYARAIAAEYDRLLSEKGSGLEHGSAA